MPRKNIKFNDKEKTRRFARNTRVIKEIERLIKVEKGIKININKVNKFPKEYADQLTKKEKIIISKIVDNVASKFQYFPPKI